MSAQLMRPEITAFASNDPLRASDQEASLAWRNYIGYWGTYTINVKAGIITHHIEGAWLTNWVGQDQTRAFHLSGDSLSLDADSLAWHAHLHGNESGERNSNGIPSDARQPAIVRCIDRCLCDAACDLLRLIHYKRSGWL